MTSPKYAYLIAVTILAACAAGRTMRVADGEEGEAEPVALAPAPEPEPDTATSLPSPDTAIVQTAPDSTSQHQGYAPYGNSKSLELRRLGQWTRTGIAESRRLVIRDANAWAGFWSELGVGDRPDVDFNRDMVIAVAAGQRSSGGHEIAVERIDQANDALTIGVVETSPGPNCMTTASLTQPVDVVVIPRVNDRTWSFVERKEVRGCR
jgi:hypothetical protein